MLYSSCLVAIISKRYTQNVVIDVSAANSPLLDSYSATRESRWKHSRERYRIHDILTIYLLLRAHKASSESRRHNASDSDLSIIWATAVLLRACVHARVHVYVCMCVHTYVHVCTYIYNCAKRVDGKEGLEAEYWKRNCDDGYMDWVHRDVW